MHVHSHCIRSRVNGASKVKQRELPFMRKCKFCFHSETCLICNDFCDPNNSIACPCNKCHMLCQECLMRHMKRECIESEPSIIRDRNFDVSCPCGYGVFDPQQIPRWCHEIWCEGIKRGSQSTALYRMCPVENAIQNILTLRCPNCNVAFLDFDACAAVYCNCLHWFCALCMQDIGTKQEAHAHVKECHLNPNPESYYVNLEEWSAIQEKRIAVKLRQHILEVATESRSILYTLGVARLIIRHDRVRTTSFLFHGACACLWCLWIKTQGLVTFLEKFMNYFVSSIHSTPSSYSYR